MQEQLWNELLDRDALGQLESASSDMESPVINWCPELVQGGCRLYALWNRSAGDCLLDSALQACWGVCDRDNTLRRALAESLSEASSV